MCIVLLKCSYYVTSDVLRHSWRALLKFYSCAVPVTALQTSKTVPTSCQVSLCLFQSNMYIIPCQNSQRTEGIGIHFKGPIPPNCVHFRRHPMWLALTARVHIIKYLSRTRSEARTCSCMCKLNTLSQWPKASSELPLGQFETEPSLVLYEHPMEYLESTSYPAPVWFIG